jgi:hypothetical protein
LSREDILFHRKAVIAAEATKNARNEREYLDRMAPQAGYTKGNGATAQPPAKPASNVIPLPNPDTKPVSPSAGAESKLAATKAGEANAAGTGGNSFFDSF